MERSRQRVGDGRFLRDDGAGPRGDPAQETTFHVDVKLVNIFVNVTDKNGAIVGGLTKDDFAVFEDNRPQQIAVFERQPKCR